MAVTSGISRSHEPVVSPWERCHATRLVACVEAMGAEPGTDGAQGVLLLLNFFVPSFFVFSSR
jgi:hypothetical protein